MIAQQGDSVRLQVSSPTLFNFVALFICTAYGLVLLFPTLLAMMSVSLLGLGLHTLALPFATLVVTTFFLPFGFGNTYLTKLARRFKPREDPAFLVQLTCVPRLRSGLRAVIEDADDIGWLICSGQALTFAGDSVSLHIPVSQVKAVRLENSGFRGLFLYSRLSLELSGHPNLGLVKFAERSSLMLPQSRALTRELHAAVNRHLVSNRPATSS